MADAPSPHGLNSAHHTGTLDNSQIPQALLTDGTRTLAGNLAVSSGVTVDGVDISVLKNNYDTHLGDPVAHNYVRNLLSDDDEAAPKGVTTNDVKIYGVNGTTVTKTVDGLAIDGGGGGGGGSSFSGIKDPAATGVAPDGSGWILTTDDNVVNVAASGANTLAFTVTQANISHGSIGGVSANQHHNQQHLFMNGSGLGPDHTVSGLTEGTFLRASSATTLAFGGIAHSELQAVTANQHHNQAHVLATNTALGADHTISGATAGHVLRASSATAAAFAQLALSDLSGAAIGTNLQAWDANLDQIAALAVTDSNIIVGNGSAWVAESGATARTSLGVGTGDSPQFTAVELGHATDTTIARVSAGLISVEGNTVTLNTATQTLTNKTLTAPVIATIVNTGTLTLPTSTDTMVGRATTDTLTNKTLTAPVIATIVNTGTLTLPTSTDTLVGRATTDTLTNKTLTAPQINDTSADHQYIVGVSELIADRTVTLPLLTGNDTFVFADFTQTLTNKTLTTPTIGSFVNATHTHQNAAGGGTLDHGLALTGLTDDDHTQYLLATGARTGASSSSQTFTTGVIDSSLTASRLMASNASKKLASADISDWIAGTSNQVTVTDDLDGTATLSLPQNIHSAATPTFSRLTLSQTTGTSPLTVSSTTVVSNLNADKADGYDFDQDVRTTGVPQFARIGVGAAAHASNPLTVNGHATMTSAQVNGALTVTDDLTVTYGGYTPLFVNVNTVTPNNSNVGIMGTPDAQFALDVFGPARAELFIGPHALQLKDAKMIVHFDGPPPFETNYAGFSAGHMGQVGTETGGVIYRPGKFQKAVQVAEATTNLVTNPSFETGIWSSYGTPTTRSVSTAYTLYGSQSGYLVGDSSGDGMALNVGTLTSGTVYTLSGYVKWVSGTVYIAAIESGSPYTARAVTPNVTSGSDWQRVSVTWTQGVTESVNVVCVAGNGSAYFDGIQLEAKAYATPYCDGSLGNGHSWSGTAHASTSSRTNGVITYALTGMADVGTLAAWVKFSVPLDGTLTGLGYNDFIMLVGSSGENTDSCCLRWVDTSGLLQVRVQSGGAAKATNDISSVAAETWHHVAWTWDASTNASAVYVDGLQAHTTTFPAFSVDLTTLYLNQNQKGGMLVDDLVILSCAATEDEIRAIYESDAPVFAESSVFSFRSPSRSAFWVDEEGAWMRSYSGNDTFGIYAGEATKSWGGLTLYDSDLAIGNSTAGYMHWHSGVDADDTTYYGAASLQIAGRLHVKGNSTIDGSLTMGTGGYIKSGATAYNTGAGFWLEYNAGTPRMFLGTAAGNKLTWDGTNLNIVGGGTFSGALSAATGSFSGAVTATSGAIGGWTIGATSLTAGSGGTTTGLDSGGTNPAFYAGSATPGSAPFRVTQAGALVATSATITGAITASSGSITGPLTMSGASSSISIGTTPPASASSGTGIWLDRTGMYGLASSVLQTKIGSDGKLTAGAGAVTLDAAGLSLSNAASDAYTTPNSVKWLSGATVTSYIQSHNYTGYNGLTTRVNASSGQHSIYFLSAAGHIDGAVDAIVELRAERASIGGTLRLAMDAGNVADASLFTSNAGFSAGNGTAIIDGTVTLQDAFANTGLHIFDTNASHDLIIAPGSNLTADRTLTLTTGDADRTLTLSGNLTVDGATTITTAAATVLDDATVAAMATTLGLGTGNAPTFQGLRIVNTAFSPLSVERYSDNAFGQGVAFIKARGTSSVPTGVNSGDQIGRIMARGYIDAGTLPAASSGDEFFEVVATENWTATGRGFSTAFKTRSNGATNSSTRIFVDNAGNVGVNDTAPGYKLDVSGTLRATGAAYLTDIRPVSDSTTALQLKRSGGTAVVTVDTTNSRLGVNMTPAYTFDSLGQGRFEDSQAAASVLYVSNTSAGAAAHGLRIDTTADGAGVTVLNARSNSLQRLVVWGNGDITMCDNGGGVGIGVGGIPSYMLEVAGDAHVDDALTVDGYVAKHRTTGLSLTASTGNTTSWLISTQQIFMVSVQVSSASTTGIIEEAMWLVSRLDTTATCLNFGGNSLYHSITCDAGTSYQIRVFNNSGATRYYSFSAVRLL